MEDNGSFTNIVAKLNEDYRKFMSDYSAFYQLGESQLADNLHRTWNYYLVRGLFDSKNYLLKSYIAGLRNTTDEFVARTKKRAPQVLRVPLSSTRRTFPIREGSQSGRGRMTGQYKKRKNATRENQRGIRVLAFARPEKREKRTRQHNRGERKDQEEKWQRIREESREELISENK